MAKRGREEEGGPSGIPKTADSENLLEWPLSDDDEGTGASDSKAMIVRKTQPKQAMLSELPSAEMYEKSYMHRENLCCIEVTASDFIVTASRDGQLKFWKKLQAIRLLALFTVVPSPTFSTALPNQNLCHTV